MSITRKLAAALAAPMLAACAGLVPAPPPPPAPRADIVFSAEQGIGELVFDARHAYLSLPNSLTQASAVLVTPGTIINRKSVWGRLELAGCGLAATAEGEPPRTPALRRLDGRIYLFQPAYKAGEHALCQLERASEWFQPRDEGLRAGAGGDPHRLWMTDLQSYGGQLFSNAGAGPNVLASDDNGRSWRALLGRVERHACAHQAFRIVGKRLLTAGACPRGAAFLRAYPMALDGLHLAVAEALPIALPELGGSQFQFIGEGGTDALVLAGVEGGLLRSIDGARSFEFALRYSPHGPRYPHIGQLLALRNDPHTILAGGFDQASGQPYLAMSRDLGQEWTDISAVLPGYAQGRAGAALRVTALVQDPAGRILVSLNGDRASTGHLVLLSLGRAD